MHVQKETLSTHLHPLTVLQARQKINQVGAVFHTEPKLMLNMFLLLLICFTGILNAASVHYITVSLQFSSVMIKNGPYVSSVLVLISVDRRRFPCCPPWTMRRWRRTWSKAETDSSPCFFKRCVGCVFIFLPPYFLSFLYLHVVWTNYFLATHSFISWRTKRHGTSSLHQQWSAGVSQC